ncbi:hypothetical protein M422DRAFT_70137 [Sphaerobolus stellatus SS14]|uniref:Kinetochore protein NUF2 n=1 Tax=Sphaerobolus stellatus (strain SS14) TaxID=990650 RepID=A0A0C9TW85_SPHS4|nr:hypothetical protein M422DRAFT_70137 [Sphaerobolus stellatus SS14]
MASTWSYPPVDVYEAAAVLQTWGFTGTADDLKSPKGLRPEVIQEVYAIAVHKLTGLTWEQLEESAERSLSVIEEYKTLIAPSARLHVLLYHATRVAEGAGIDDFSMMDLVTPTASRTEKILSAVINFGRFSEERQPFVERLQQQYTKASGERDELQQQILELRQKLEGHRAQLKADEPICAQLAAENHTLSARLRDLFEEQNEVVQEAEAFKLERDNLIGRKAGIQDEIAVALDTNARTKARIVQSPDRIRRIIATMEESVRLERQTISDNEGKARALKMKLDALATSEQDVRFSIEHLQALEVEHNALNDSLAKLGSVKAELDRQTLYRNELQQQKDRVLRRKANAEEKLEREQKYADNQRAKSQGTIAKLKQEFEEMALERRDNDHVVEENKKAAAEIDRKMAEHLRQNEEEMSKLLAEYWRLRHQTEVYMETLANKLGLDLEGVAA